MSSPLILREGIGLPNLLRVFSPLSASDMSGTVTWSVAYYEKARLNPKLKLKAGVDHSLPKELQDHPQLKVEADKQDTEEEANASRIPPDPAYPAGILSVIVHNIFGLERQHLSGKKGRVKDGQTGQDTEEDPEAEANDLPSGYVEMCGQPRRSSAGGRR